MALSQQKQVLKKIKELLLKESSDFQQVDCVILQLAKKKDLSLDVLNSYLQTIYQDIDAARQLMKVKRKRSVQHNQQLTIPSNINEQTIDTQTSKGFLTTVNHKKSQSTAHKNLKTIILPEISPRGINGSIASGAFEFHKIPTKTDILKMSQIQQNARNLEFNHRPLEVANPDKFDVWHALVEDDTNRYKMETERSFNQRKFSQAQYKSFLEKQMEQQKAMQSLNHQQVMEEGEKIKNNVKELAEKEFWQKTHKRLQMKGIVEENNVNNQIQNYTHQQEKQRIQMEEKEQAEKLMRLQQQQKQKELINHKIQQRKVSYDLQFIQAQNQILKDFKHQEDSQSQNNSPRVNVLMPNGTVVEQQGNPFIDKADIARHKNKIQSLVRRNDRNLSLFEKYTVSPKDTAIMAITERNTSFQTILDERNRNQAENSKSIHRQMIEDNFSLQNMKEQAKIQKLKHQIEVERKLNDQDNQQYSMIKQREIREKINKQQYVKTGLDDQFKVKQDNKKQIELGVTPIEVSINKDKIQNLGVDQSSLIINKSGIKL